MKEGICGEGGGAAAVARGRMSVVQSRRPRRRLLGKRWREQRRRRRGRATAARLPTAFAASSHSLATAMLFKRAPELLLAATATSTATTLGPKMSFQDTSDTHGRSKWNEFNVFKGRLHRLNHLIWRVSSGFNFLSKQENSRNERVQQTTSCVWRTRVCSWFFLNNKIRQMIVQGLNLSTTLMRMLWRLCGHFLKTCISLVHI